MDLEANKYNKSNKLQIRDGKELMARIVEENPNENFEVILDIGCGSGNLTLLLSKAFNARQIVAVDVDPEMIAFAKEHHSKDSITYVAQDFGSDWEQLSPVLQALEGKVSLIFTNHCLHWIHNRENVVKNLHRLLSKTGKIYANIYWITDLFLDLSSEQKAIHEKEFMKIPTKEEQFDIWYNLFKNNGFNVSSNKFLLKDCSFELNFWEENVLPLGLSIRKIYFAKSDSEQNKTKVAELFRRAYDRCERSIDEETGQTTMTFKYGYYQFVLVRKS